jgi:hypothetical protein
MSLEVDRHEVSLRLFSSPGTTFGIAVSFLLRVYALLPGGGANNPQVPKARTIAMFLSSGFVSFVFGPSIQSMSFLNGLHDSHK